MVVKKMLDVIYLASMNSIASSEIINYWHDGNNRRDVEIKIIAVKIKHDIIQSKAAATELLQMRMLACCVLLG